MSGKGVTREIRFAVGTPEEMHSGVWKVWAQGDELYTAQVAMPVLYKLSVHGSGVCRLASTSDQRWPAGLQLDRDERVLHRWQIEPVGTSDWCHCFCILVPSIYVRERLDIGILPREKAGQITWIPPAPLSRATRILALRARSPDLELHDYLTGEDLVLAALDLRSGSRIWLVVDTIALSRADFGEWQREVAQVRAPFAQDPGTMLSTITSPADHDFPVIRQVALGRENFPVTGS